MPDSIDTLARAYAVELLTTLNDQPHIKKEQLFADAVAYYRWLLKDEKAQEALTIYWYEFEAHHKTLIARMEPDVRVGCFITWFVEQGFHTLPPLTMANVVDKEQLRLVQRTRFSRPSFHLPTGDPVESYLMQWLYWHLDNLPNDNLEAEELLILHCSFEMMSEIDYEVGEHNTLLTNSTRFLTWCRKELRTWDTFMELFARFLGSEAGRASDQSNVAWNDACFVAWFCQNVLDPSEQSQTVAPREHDA